MSPGGARRPKIAEHLIEGGPLAWRFSGCDKAGPFSWHALSEAKHHEVLGKLHEFETKNWEEILRGGSHPIPLVDCAAAARGRLSDLERDDIDELMSFRLSARERIWCIKWANVMSVLWWDPEHLVYPVKPDKADREKDRRKRGR